MKKNRFLYGAGYKLAMPLMLALFVFPGCSAHPNNATPPPIQNQAQRDSVMRFAISDSIYEVITQAKKIKAEEIIMTNDTTQAKKTTVIDVKGKFIPLVQFALSNPKIYRGNTAVFGQFMPCFKLIFIKKKELFVLNFDFGLKKWNVCDGKGRVIKMFDLSSDDMLRIANMLFPDNELFIKQINSEKK